jgi:hypothetical protein
VQYAIENTIGGPNIAAKYVGRKHYWKELWRSLTVN